jgi:hypothetical protein
MSVRNENISITNTTIESPAAEHIAPLTQPRIFLAVSVFDFKASKAKAAAKPQRNKMTAKRT